MAVTVAVRRVLMQYLVLVVTAVIIHLVLVELLVIQGPVTMVAVELVVLEVVLTVGAVLVLRFLTRLVVLAVLAVHQLHQLRQIRVYMAAAELVLVLLREAQTKQEHQALKVLLLLFILPGIIIATL